MDNVERDRSFGELVQDILSNVQSIIRAEVRLAKTEMKEQLATGRTALALVGGAAVFSFFALALLIVTATLALSTIVAAWLAALLTGIATGILGLALWRMGRAKLKQTSVPNRTIDTVKENLEWAKERTR